MPAATTSTASASASALRRPLAAAGSRSPTSYDMSDFASVEGAGTGSGGDYVRMDSGPPSNEGAAAAATSVPVAVAVAVAAVVDDEGSHEAALRAPLLGRGVSATLE